jgi:hypothetical protein
MKRTYEIANNIETFGTRTSKSEAIKAAKEIARRHSISVSVYSVTEFGFVSCIFTAE